MLFTKLPEWQFMHISIRKADIMMENYIAKGSNTGIFMVTFWVWTVNA
jgi:hypothetical protein